MAKGMKGEDLASMIDISRSRIGGIEDE